MRYAPLWGLLLAAGLSACDTTDPEEDGGLASGNLISLFEPAPAAAGASATIPFPFDGLFSGFTDPTLNIPNGTGAPFVTEANLTDGFSTTANLFTDFIGFVDLDTALQGGLLVIDTSTGTPLSPGVDYTLSDHSRHSRHQSARPGAGQRGALPHHHSSAQTAEALDKVPAGRDRSAA
mgnify:CR=1 FL=1